MVEIFSIFSPNGNLVKLERIRVLTTRVEPLVSRLVLLMIRVPVQAFLATTYIRLTLRGSYTIVSICSPNRFISCFSIIRSITIIYGLIISLLRSRLSRCHFRGSVAWRRERRLRRRLAYHRPTQRPAPSWPDGASQVAHCKGKRRGHGSSPRSSLCHNYFTLKLRQFYTFVSIRRANKCISCIDIIP